MGARVPLYKEGQERITFMRDDACLMKSAACSCQCLTQVYSNATLPISFFRSFEKRWQRFFSPPSGVVRCAWINSAPPSVSSLVRAIQLCSYLELN